MSLQELKTRMRYVRVVLQLQWSCQVSSSFPYNALDRAEYCQFVGLMAGGSRRLCPVEKQVVQRCKTGAVYSLALGLAARERLEFCLGKRLLKAGSAD